MAAEITVFFPSFFFFPVKARTDPSLYRNIRSPVPSMESETLLADKKRKWMPKVLQTCVFSHSVKDDLIAPAIHVYLTEMR